MDRNFAIHFFIIVSIIDGQFNQKLSAFRYASINASSPSFP